MVDMNPTKQPFSNPPLWSNGVPMDLCTEKRKGFSGGNEGYTYVDGRSISLARGISFTHCFFELDERG